MTELRTRFLRSTVKGIVGAIVFAVLMHACPAYKRRFCEQQCAPAPPSAEEPPP